MRLKLILLGLAAVIILGRWSYINTKGIDRIVYNNDTCDTYFSGDTLIIYTSTQTIMKIHGDSLSKLIFNEDTITPARIACIDANCDSAYLIFNGGEDSIKIGGHVSGAGYTQDTIFTYDTIGVNDSLRVGDTWFTDDDLVPISGDNLVKGVGAAGKLAVWIDDDSIAYSSNLDNSNVYIDNASNTGLGYNVPNVGVGNSAFGDRSLTSTISGGNYNTGIGTFSLHSNTTGDYNIGLGPNAGYYNTTLSNRFFVNPYSSRGSLLNDSTMSLLYGVGAATAVGQRLWVNGDLYIPYEFTVRDTPIVELITEHASAVGGTVDTSSAFTATELLVATGSTTAESEDSLTWSGGELTVTGNTDLNGILFTGSTQTAGAFYTGTSTPTNANRGNYDGQMHMQALYLEDDDNTYYNAIDRNSMEIIANSVSEMKLIPEAISTNYSYYFNAVNDIDSIFDIRKQGISLFKVKSDGIDISTNLNIKDSLTWSGGELTVTGNTDLNGILFTGSTQTAGAFYTGTSNPSNTNRLNYDGNLVLSELGVGGDGLSHVYFNKTDNTRAVLWCENSGTNRAALFTGGGGIQISKDAYNVDALYILDQTSYSNNVTADWMDINLSPNLNSNDISGDIIRIVDNPSNVGTNTSKVFTVEIESTERISMNPRVNSGTSNEAYLWDTHNPLTGAKHSIWANQGDTLAVLDSISLRVKNIFSVQDSLIIYPDSSVFTGYHVADSFVMTDRTIVSDFVFEKGYNYGSFWKDLQYAMQNKTLPSLKSHSRSIGTRQENTIEALERLYLQMADELAIRDKRIARLEKKVVVTQLVRSEKVRLVFIGVVIVWLIILTLTKIIGRKK